MKPRKKRIVEVVSPAFLSPFLSLFCFILIKELWAVSIHTIEGRNGSSLCRNLLSWFLEGQGRTNDFHDILRNLKGYLVALMSRERSYGYEILNHLASRTDFYSLIVQFEHGKLSSLSFWSGCTRNFGNVLKYIIIDRIRELKSVFYCTLTPFMTRKNVQCQNLRSFDVCRLRLIIIRWRL